MWDVKVFSRMTIQLREKNCFNYVGCKASHVQQHSYVFRTALTMWDVKIEIKATIVSAVSAGIEWRLLPKLLTEGAFQPLWRK